MRPRGETTGFISWYADLWLDEPITLRAFRSLLGVSASSACRTRRRWRRCWPRAPQDQQEVTDQLGYQVRAGGRDPGPGPRPGRPGPRAASCWPMCAETRLYEAALTVMMRLVFLLSAEERGLLPLDDPFYDRELRRLHPARAAARARPTSTARRCWNGATTPGAACWPPSARCTAASSTTG